MPHCLRVLQISRAIIRGGFDYHREISRAFADQPFQFTTVFIRGRLPDNETRGYWGDVIFLEAKRRKYFKLPWVVALKLLLLSRGKPFDLAICHHYAAAVAVNLLVKLGRVGKMYFVVHDYDYFSPADRPGQKRQQFVTRLLDRRCKLIAVSKALRSNILNCLPGLEPERCVVIPNTIDDHQLTTLGLERQEARRALGIDPNCFVFGAIGRLVPCKAHSELIEAFAQVQTLMPDSRLVIIGGGKLHDVLAAQIERLNLAAEMKLLGFVPKAARYMSAFDVFVFPSHNEGFGLVLLEAMVNCLPIIARDSGPVPEIIPYHDGFFRSGDTGSLASKLLHFYRLPPEQRRHLGETGYRYVQQNFSLEHYRECYRRLGTEP
jgi:glycosyltransferase involved in cell wall biosynthesis